MVPPLTPLDTAQRHGVSFHCSPPASGAPPAADLPAAPQGHIDTAALLPSRTGEPRVHQPSLRQVADAQRKLRILAAYRAAVSGGMRSDDAVKRLRRQGHDVSRASIARWERAEAASGFDGLIDQRRGHSGRRRSALRVSDTEAEAIRALVLRSNRTSESGSVPEALRGAVRSGLVAGDVAQEWADRERDGRGVPDALRRELVIAPAVVRQHRNPTDAGLDYLCAPGSSRYIDDPTAPGGRRAVRVGDVLEADDATINFCAVIPWEMGGCPCSERYGVKVGRFQWLVAIDRASLFIPGWSYTARPRQSYRAEDVVSLFGGIFREHGIWSRLCLEQGVWKSDRVTAMLEGLGIDRMTAWSPHGKAYIEGLFNLLWTKLSLTMPGQVGRFRGEEEKTDAILRSCQTGATDPRTIFPMLGDALAALRQATADRNAQPVHSSQYGSWVPQERWLAQQQEAREQGRLRRLHAESAWMFAPAVRDWVVRRGCATGEIQLMDGFSLEFSFTAEWMPNYDGRRVRCFFDPAAPQCDATVVLLENALDSRAGDVLGTACQVNENASVARAVFQWGQDDREAGLKARAVNAAAMRREVRTLRASGETGFSSTEVRDGLGRSVRAETAAGAGEAAPAAPAAPRRARNPLAPSTPEEFTRRGGLLARLAAATDSADSELAPIFSPD